MNESKNKKWLLWVLLIFFPPIGIIYMWITKKDFTKQTKIILSVVFSLWFIIVLASGNSESNNSNKQNVGYKVSKTEQSTSSIQDKTTSATKETQANTTKATQPETETQTQEATTEQTTTEEETTEPETMINTDNNENNSDNNVEGNENNFDETEPYITATTSANLFTYVLNTSTKKFHFPSCSEVKKIKDTNYSEYTGTADEVISMGYAACKRCYPH